MTRCGMCKHWRPYPADDKFVGFGTCESPKFARMDFGAEYTCDDGLQRGCECGGEGPWLDTGPQFGCVHWEAQEEEENKS